MKHQKKEENDTTEWFSWALGGPIDVLPVGFFVVVGVVLGGLFCFFAPFCSLDVSMAFLGLKVK